MVDIEIKACKVIERGPVNRCDELSKACVRLPRTPSPETGPDTPELSDARRDMPEEVLIEGDCAAPSDSGRTAEDIEDAAATREEPSSDLSAPLRGLQSSGNAGESVPEDVDAEIPNSE